MLFINHYCLDDCLEEIWTYLNFVLSILVSAISLDFIGCYHSLIIFCFIVRWWCLIYSKSLLVLIFVYCLIFPTVFVHHYPVGCFECHLSVVIQIYFLRVTSALTSLTFSFPTFYLILDCFAIVTLPFLVDSRNCLSVDLVVNFKWLYADYFESF